MKPIGKTDAKANRSNSAGGLIMWVLKAALVLFVMMNLYIFGVGVNFFLTTATRISCPINGHGVNNSSASASAPPPVNVEENELRVILEQTAVMPNKTVILTYLNQAWIAPNSMFDVFIESFRIGNNTQHLLNHLLVVSLDDKAHQHCLAVHPHCYQLPIDPGLNVTEAASYKSPKYFKIVWQKIDFLRSVLDLGFNFLFTDGDIVWLRDPFSHLVLTDSPFQVACEKYMGDPFNLTNDANTGFMYVASNPQTILFYKLWHSARLNYKRMHDQEIFNIMRRSPLFQIIGLRPQFLDTDYFNGFCQRTRDYSKVITVHATCRIGLERKVNELKGVLDNWRNYSSSPPVLS